MIRTLLSIKVSFEFIFANAPADFGVHLKTQGTVFCSFWPLEALNSEPDVFSGIVLSEYCNSGFLSNSIEDALDLFIVGAFNKLVG